MNNWYSDALKYANRLATNSGGWKEGEQEEVKKVLSFIGGMHDKATEDSEEDSLYNVFHVVSRNLNFYILCHNIYNSKYMVDLL